MDLIWENSYWTFFFLTVVIAGGAAFATGRAIARQWKPNATLFFYIALLTAADRFLHFALFDGTLLSLYYYVTHLIVLLAIAFIGRSLTRADQMRNQYRFRSSAA